MNSTGRRQQTRDGSKHSYHLDLGPLLKLAHQTKNMEMAPYLLPDRSSSRTRAQCSARTMRQDQYFTEFLANNARQSQSGIQNEVQL